MLPVSEIGIAYTNEGKYYSCETTKLIPGWRRMINIATKGQGVKDAATSIELEFQGLSVRKRI